MSGRAINDQLWQFDCGCIESARPYRVYPCREHHQNFSDVGARQFLIAAGVVGMLCLWALCGLVWGWVIWG